MIFFFVAVAALLIASFTQSLWIRASLYTWAFAALAVLHYNLIKLADLSGVGRDGFYTPQPIHVDELPYTLVAISAYCFAIAWIFVVETRKLPCTIRKKIAISSIAIAGVATYAIIITVANPGWRLSWAYPGAEIGLDWPPAHSYHPYLSGFIRKISPVTYIGSGEYAVVNLTRLSYPLRFEAIHRERVIVVNVLGCTIRDISALLPAQGRLPDVAFVDCDLSQLPKEQRDQLKTVWDAGLHENAYWLNNR